MITLTSEQQRSLEDELAAGRLSPIESALRMAVAEAINADDLRWAKPYVNEARKLVVRNDVVSGEEFFAGLDERLKALRLRAQADRI